MRRCGRRFAQAREEPIPIVFAHTRRSLSKALHRSMKSSVAAVLNYDGANDEFKEVLRLARARQELWVQWAALPAQQQGAARYEAQLRASLGDELFARRVRMQLQCSGNTAFHAPRSLILEPKRPTNRQTRAAAAVAAAADGQAAEAAAQSKPRRYVDPVLLDLGLL